jgi:hypothetical protein
MPVTAAMGMTPRPTVMALTAVTPVTVVLVVLAVMPGWGRM